MAISKKTWLGLAVESTPGTAVTTPVRYIPCKSTMKSMRKPEYSDEDRGTRDKNFHVVYGPRSGSLDVKGGWFNDAHGVLLYGAMGADTVTQPDATHCPTVYKHTLALADIPPVFTLMKSYQTQTYYLPYAAVEKFSLKWNADSKIVEYETSFKSRYPQVLGSAAPTPAFTTVRQFAGYAPTLTLGSLGATTGDISEVSISFTQKVDVWQPSNGSPDFVGLYFGERELKVDWTARFDVAALHNYWDATTDDSITIDIQGDTIASYSGTNYNQELNLVIPILNYDSFEHDEGKTNVLCKVKGTARPKADLSQALFSAFVQNTVASYTAG